MHGEVVSRRRRRGEDRGRPHASASTLGRRRRKALSNGRRVGRRASSDIDSCTRGERVIVKIVIRIASEARKLVSGLIELGVGSAERLRLS